MRDIEIEIQVNVERVQPLVDFLETQGTFQGEERQKDEYFSPAHRDFLAVEPVNEWLRLRQVDPVVELRQAPRSGHNDATHQPKFHYRVDGRTTFDYKSWHRDEKGVGLYCDEYGTAVTDAGTMRKILTALNFRSVVTVDKIRKTWLYDKYLIALDTVKNLGDFVEVEYNGEDVAVVDPKAVTDAMIQFLKDRGCGTIKRNHKGYPFLLLFPEEREDEVV